MSLAALVVRWASRSGAILSNALIAGALIASVAGLTGCGPDNPVETSSIPEETDFAAVSEALGVRCGSLDCHGMAERNLRLYGQFGLSNADHLGARSLGAGHSGSTSDPTHAGAQGAGR